MKEEEPWLNETTPPIEISGAVSSTRTTQQTCTCIHVYCNHSDTKQNVIFSIFLFAYITCRSCNFKLKLIIKTYSLYLFTTNIANYTAMSAYVSPIWLQICQH